jgi:hypothetical protein
MEVETKVARVVFMLNLCFFRWTETNHKTESFGVTVQEGKTIVLRNIAREVLRDEKAKFAVCYEYQWSERGDEYMALFGKSVCKDVPVPPTPKKSKGRPQKKANYEGGFSALHGYSTKIIYLQVSLGDLWYYHRDTPKYLGRIFLPPPEEPDPGFLNLWAGYNIPPESCRGICATDEHTNVCDENVVNFLNYIREVWCRNDRYAFDFVQYFFAHLLRYPGKRFESIIVLLGEKEWEIIQIFGEIMGTRYLHNVEKVTGKMKDIDKLLLIVSDDLHAEVTAKSLAQALESPTFGMKKNFFSDNSNNHEKVVRFAILCKSICSFTNERQERAGIQFHPLPNR